MQKTDRRIRKTKALLQNSLLELMETKTLNHITIKELTDYADVNRSTFYLHYNSINDVLIELEQDLLNQINEVFDRYPKDDDENSFSFISARLQILFDNLKTCNVLLNSKYNTGFVEQLQEILWKKIAERLQYILGSDFQASIYLSSFYISGCMGLVRAWQADENRPAPEQMARACYQLVMNAIDQIKQIDFEEISL